MRSRHCFYAVLSVCSILLSASVSGAETAPIQASAPATAFLSGEKLDFQGIENAKWILTDWRGNKLREGFFRADGKLQLASLPVGYYELRVQAGSKTVSRSFAVVPNRPMAQRNPEMFYAFDTALSWMGYCPKSLTAEAAYRSGSVIVRERLAWRECEKAPGQYDFTKYLKTTSELKKRNITISDIFHDAPAFARGKNASLPSDLYSLYCFCRELAKTFKGRTADWEFWNEEDIGFAKEGAWDYASAMKAAYLGFKAGDPKLDVALGGLAHAKMSNYGNIIFENGLKDYIDIINLHTYEPFCDYPGIFSSLHGFLKKHGIEQRPLWFTETGTGAEGSGRLESGVKNIKAHDRDQENIVAELLPKQMITMQSCGVDRCFWFILPPFYENGGAKVWGLMRHDGSVKPAFSAYAAMVENLGFAEIQGELNLGKDIRAYLFRQKDGSQTLVYWQVSVLETEGNKPNRKFTELPVKTFQIKVPAGVYKGTNIFGTPCQLKTNGKTLTLNAERFVNYIHGLSGLNPDRAAVKTTRKKTDSNAPIDRTVIYRVKPGKMFELQNEKDSVDLKGKSGTVELEIWNLSPVAKIGNIAISGCRIESVPGKIEIKPFTKVSFLLKITPEFNAGNQAKMIISGTFNNRKTSVLTMPIINLGKMVSSKSSKQFPQMLDPANWVVNSSGKMKISYDEKNTAVVFEGTFSPDTDCWIYPEYILQLPQESLKGAKRIYFEWKVDVEKPLRYAILMCVVKGKNNNVSNIYLPLPLKTGKWVKHNVSLTQQNIDPESIIKIRIGVNPTCNVRYSVRNIRILY